MKSKKRCNCPCHQGAGVIHTKFIPSNEPIKLDDDFRMKSYSSSGSSVMVPCPCELNIKIQELTEEYYGAA